jgi:hypothetical protein
MIVGVVLVIAVVELELELEVEEQTVLGCYFLFQLVLQQQKILNSK